MLTTWRLTRPQYVATALSGEGSARYPGRWNVRGRRVAYVSEHLSLATLEVLAHAETVDTLNQYVALRVSLPADSVTTARVLPDNWQQNPPSAATRELGETWFRAGETLLFKVPSVLIPNEHNYLLNPAHEAFQHVEVAEAVPLPFDARILQLTES